MALSKSTVSVLVDMIENKLALLQISGREELRELVTLQRCLSELKGMGSSDAAATAIPTRGRHRKLDRMMDDYGVTQELRQRA